MGNLCFRGVSDGTGSPARAAGGPMQAEQNKLKDNFKLMAGSMDPEETGTLILNSHLPELQDGEQGRGTPGRGHASLAEEPSAVACNLPAVNVPPDMARSLWSLEQFQLKKLLHKGDDSIVLEAIDKVSNREVVLKVYEQGELCAMRAAQVQREVELHAGLEPHVHVVRLLAAFEDMLILGNLGSSIGRSSGLVPRVSSTNSSTAPLREHSLSQPLNLKKTSGHFQPAGTGHALSGLSADDSSCSNVTPRAASNSRARGPAQACSRHHSQPLMTGREPGAGAGSPGSLDITQPSLSAEGNKPSVFAGRLAARAAVGGVEGPKPRSASVAEGGTMGGNQMPCRSAPTSSMSGALMTRHVLVLVLERAGAGNLLQLLHSAGGRMREAGVVKLVLSPLLQALQHLHEKCGIVHRDIKPENICFDEKGCLKLIDLGAAICFGNERVNTQVGTLSYMAPEVLQCPPKVDPGAGKLDSASPAYDMAADIWAVGCVLYELLTGSPPFGRNGLLGSPEYRDLAKRGQGDDMFAAAAASVAGLVFPERMNKLAREFILECLRPEPEARPLASSLLHHPLVSGHMEPADPESVMMRAAMQQQAQIERALESHQAQQGAAQWQVQQGQHGQHESEADYGMSPEEWQQHGIEWAHAHGGQSQGHGPHQHGMVTPGLHVGAEGLVALDTDELAEMEAEALEQMEQMERDGGSAGSGGSGGRGSVEGNGGAVDVEVEIETSEAFSTGVNSGVAGASAAGAGMVGSTASSGMFAQGQGCCQSQGQVQVGGQSLCGAAVTRPASAGAAACAVAGSQGEQQQVGAAESEAALQTRQPGKRISLLLAQDPAVSQAQEGSRGAAKTGSSATGAGARAEAVAAQVGAATAAASARFLATLKTHIEEGRGQHYPHNQHQHNAHHNHNPQSHGQSGTSCPPSSQPSTSAVSSFENKGNMSRSLSFMKLLRSPGMSPAPSRLPSMAPADEEAVA